MLEPIRGGGWLDESGNFKRHLMDPVTLGVSEALFFSATTANGDSVRNKYLRFCYHWSLRCIKSLDLLSRIFGNSGGQVVVTFPVANKQHAHH